MTVFIVFELYRILDTSREEVFFLSFTRALGIARPLMYVRPSRLTIETITLRTNTLPKYKEPLFYVCANDSLNLLVCFILGFIPLRIACLDLTGKCFILFHLGFAICDLASRNESHGYFLRFGDFCSIVHSIDFSLY